MAGAWRRLAGAISCGALLCLPAAVGADGHEWGALSLDRPPGLPAPDFSLADLEGRSWSLRDLRGRVVLVNFWASWCAPCGMETPAIQRLHSRLKTAGLTVLAVNFMEPAGRVRDYAREHGNDFPVLLDPDGAVFAGYAVQTLPLTVLVDRRGEVRAVAQGPRNWEDAAAANLIERLGRLPQDIDTDEPKQTY
jgi:peroxiredoxin